MIEQVRDVEQEAAKIRDDAALEAREMLAATQAGLRDKALREVEAERLATRKALEQAEADGRTLAEGILAERAAEADAVCRQAEANLDRAADYLVGRVVSTA